MNDIGFRTRRTSLRALVVAAVLATSLSLVPIPSTPAGAAGGGVVDLTGAVPASFTVTPGVEQVTVTGRSDPRPADPGRRRHPRTHRDRLHRRPGPTGDPLRSLRLPGVRPPRRCPAHHRGRAAPARRLPAGQRGHPRRALRRTRRGQRSLHRPRSRRRTRHISVRRPGAPLGADRDHRRQPQPGHTDEEGYGYLEVRDGTLLSVNVRLPDPGQYGPGPYPTVVQYSGYAPSKPGVPSGADAGGVLANVLGFAYVGVNLRGSGCSGGTFDVFNAAQAADGYDVVETVARQPWVKHGTSGNDGHLLLGDHPALRGRHQPAPPGGHHPGVGHRGSLVPAVARWHLQLRVHPAMAGQPRRRVHRRRRVGPRPHHRRRHHLRDQPADPQPEHPLRGVRPLLEPPTPGGRRPQPVAAGPRDRRARLPDRCLAGRADRGPVRQPCSTTSILCRRARRSSRCSTENTPTASRH